MKSVFIFLIILSVVLFFLSRISAIGSIFEGLFSPISGAAIIVSRGTATPKSEIETLQKQNRELLSQVVQLKTLQRDNAILKEQFKQAAVDNTLLIPASIVGRQQLISGISEVEYFILNVGKKSGVAKDMFVVSDNNLVGIIEEVLEYHAKVKVLSKMDNSFTVSVQSSKSTVALSGIAKLQNGGILLDNIGLSEALHSGDIVVTKGNVGEKGSGILPNIIIGKIAAIDKDPSALFQKAQAKSMIDFAALDTVFVIAQKP